MRRSYIFCAMLALSIGLHQPAIAQNDPEAIMGPMAGKIQPGTSGAWTVSFDNGRLNLVNAGDANAIRFYSGPWMGNEKARSVSVRIDLPDASSVGAGLVLRMQDQFPRWTAVVITPKKKLAIYNRTAAGLPLAGLFDLPDSKPDEGYLLQFSDNGQDMAVLVNGRQITTLKPDLEADGSRAPPKPVGIIALGAGHFGLRGFAFGGPVQPQVVADSGNDDSVPVPAGDGGGPKPVPKPKQSELQQQAGGAVVSILAHEFGHFMIGELKIPATGPEEDVADEFAAQVFIDNARKPPPSGDTTAEEFKTAALGGAKFWLFMANEREAKNQQSPWFDEHSPDKIRFGKFMCNLYGAFPKDFEVLMEKAGIPVNRRQRCVADREKADRAWGQLLRSHRRKGADPAFPGDLPADAPGKKITAVYAEIKTAGLKQIADGFKNGKVLEMLADEVSRIYVLPRDTKIIGKECGYENAFYQPDDGSVTLCYEIVSAVINAFVKNEKEGGGQTPKPPEKPTINLSEFFVGTWQAQSYSQFGQETLTVKYFPDGSFQGRRAISGAIQFYQEISGRYAAEPLEGLKINFTTAPTAWNPQFYCLYPGNCIPMNLSRATNVMEILDKNTVKTGDVVGHRMQ